MKANYLAAAAGLALAFSSSVLGQALDPATFDLDKDLHLSKRELSLFVIKRDKLNPKVGEFLGNNLKLAVTPEELERAILDDLLLQASGSVGLIAANIPDAREPYPIAAVVAALAKLEAPKPSPRRLALPAPWGDKLKQGDSVLGPIALRKSVDDAEKNLTDAAGAKLSHSRNRITNKTTWLTEGALIFPITGEDNTRSGDQLSERWKLLPSISWKVVQVAGTPAGDAEELQFKMPMVSSVNHGNAGALRNSELSFAPYFLTDFGFRGKVAGASLSYTPYVKPANGGLQINTGYRFTSPTSLWQYRIGWTPTLDYNHLYDTSRFITRAGTTDYFRGGVRAEIGLLSNTQPAVELRGTYKGFWRIQGGPNRSDLLSVSGKLWLNDNAGFTLEHQKGSTPVAEKEIDVTTLGLELRF